MSYGHPMDITQEVDISEAAIGLFYNSIVDENIFEIAADMDAEVIQTLEEEEVLWTEAREEDSKEQALCGQRGDQVFVCFEV